MFDTMKTAQIIREARMRKNFTQTELADRMGVSFQAVSNWERGNSMPDISKLNDLCTALDLSLDDLLGTNRKETAAVKNVIDNPNANLGDLAQIAPLVEPSRIQDAVHRTVQEKQADAATGTPAISAEQIAELAPFLDDDAWEELADSGMLTELSADVLGELAPFFPDKTLKTVTKEYHFDEMTASTLLAIAPFLSDDAWVEAAKNGGLANLDGETMAEIAPFLSDKAWEIWWERPDSAEQWNRNLSEIAPFLPPQLVKDLLIQRLRDGKDVSDISPFYNIH